MYVFWFLMYRQNRCTRGRFKGRVTCVLQVISNCRIPKRRRGRNKPYWMIQMSSAAMNFVPTATSLFMKLSIAAQYREYEQHLPAHNLDLLYPNSFTLGMCRKVGFVSGRRAMLSSSSLLDLASQAPVLTG